MKWPDTLSTICITILIHMKRVAGCSNSIGGLLGGSLRRLGCIVSAINHIKWGPFVLTPENDAKSTSRGCYHPWKKIKDNLLN
jgi:hypothetical protein